MLVRGSSSTPHSVLEATFAAQTVWAGPLIWTEESRNFTVMIHMHQRHDNGLERPQPRTDRDLQLETSERESAENLYLYLQQSLCSLYNTLTHRQNPPLYTALEFQHTQKYLLLLFARNFLIDGEASYLAQLAELESTWNKCSGENGSTYPFAFSDEERQELEADVAGAVRGMEAMRSIKERSGDLFPEQGIVKSENYEEALVHRRK